MCMHVPISSVHVLISSEIYVHVLISCVHVLISCVHVLICVGTSLCTSMAKHYFSWSCAQKYYLVNLVFRYFSMQML